MPRWNEIKGSLDITSQKSKNPSEFSSKFEPALMKVGEKWNSRQLLSSFDKAFIRQGPVVRKPNSLTLA